MTRADHIKWCVERARVYLERGFYDEAVQSMVSDLTKHEATKNLINPITASLAIAASKSGSKDDVRRFIEGFS